MADYAFLLDIARCIGCQACVAACKTGNELPTGTQYIRLTEKTSGSFPDLRGWFNNHRCMHCGKAACVVVCPTAALYKEDGLTRLDSAKCIGCGECVDACPYNVPVMTNGIATKCDACTAAVRAGGEPWCVKTCPSQALLYGDRAEIVAEAHRRVDAIQHRFPKARVYGEREAGGLGVIVVLPDSPVALELTASPDLAPDVANWRRVVQPFSLGVPGLSVAVTTIAAVIARRNRVKEEFFLRATATRPSDEPCRDLLDHGITTKE